MEDNKATSASELLSSARMRTSSTGDTSQGASSPPTRISDFDVSRIPHIYRRQLYPWSVHRSLTTSKYIATIGRAPEHCSGTCNNNHHDATNRSHPNHKIRHLQVPFKTEREARKFCKAYSPPKLLLTTGGGVHACCLCSESVHASRHCRNCGAVICERCSRRWGLRMVPKTYHATPNALTVRVCKSCDWLSNAFCMALLQGRYQDAVFLYNTGNVNLRTTFADIHREAMFPVHCAVMGGSLDLVRWLVDVQLCPLSVNRGPKGQLLSVQTSASRTLMDFAMAGKPKVEILLYLVQKGLSIHDVKDKTLAPKTLESLLKVGQIERFLRYADPNTSSVVPIVPDDIDIADPSRDESVATNMEDMCALCCEKAMDCVLVPCGHQICCFECGQQIASCPVCKANCSVLRVFRQ